MGGGVDLEEMLSQMFGMNMGMGGMDGMPPGGVPPRPGKPGKGKDEEQTYEVTLEDLFKGKTVKFASTKNVICRHCKGSGGKEKAQPKKCSSCDGNGEWTRNIHEQRNRHAKVALQASNPLSVP